MYVHKPHTPGHPSRSVWGECGLVDLAETRVKRTDRVAVVSIQNQHRYAQCESSLACNIMIAHALFTGEQPDRPVR